MQLQSLQSKLKLRTHLQCLLLGPLVQVHAKVHILQGTFQHGDGVGPVGVRVDTLLAQHSRHVPKEDLLLQSALLVRHLLRRGTL